MLTTVNRK